MTIVVDGRQDTRADVSLRLIGRIRTPFLEANGTPIQPLHIKPYVPEFDAHPLARAGWFETPGVDRRVADGRFHEPTGSTGGGRP